MEILLYLRLLLQGIERDLRRELIFMEIEKSIAIRFLFLRSVNIVDPLTSSIRPRLNEGVVAQWCNLLTLQSEQLGRMVSIPSRPLPLERHYKGLWTRLALSYFCDPSAWL